MTKEAALQNFFSGFGISAYPAECLPEDTVYPWLTYTRVIGTWGEQVSITVNLWYYGADDRTINAKARELSEVIGLGGKIIPCDNGAIWIRRGSPWCQSLKDAADDSVQRRYINITAEFFTAD